MNCHICTVCRNAGDTTDEPRPATHLCTELNREICGFHAAYCESDGHMAIPLEEIEVRMGVAP